MAEVKINHTGPYNSYNDFVAYLKSIDWLIIPPPSLPFMRFSDNTVATIKQFFDKETVTVADGVHITVSIWENNPRAFGFKFTSSWQSVGYPVTEVKINWTTLAPAEYQLYQIFTEGFDTLLNINYTYMLGGIIKIISDKIVDSTKQYKAFGLVDRRNSITLSSLSHDETSINNPIEYVTSGANNVTFFRGITRSYSIPGFLPDKVLIDNFNSILNYFNHTLLYGTGNKYEFSRSLVFWDGVTPEIPVPNNVFSKLYIEGFELADTMLGFISMDYVYSESDFEYSIRLKEGYSLEDYEHSENVTIEWLTEDSILLTITPNGENIFEDSFIKLKEGTPVGGEDEEWQLMMLALKAKGEKNG